MKLEDIGFYTLSDERAKSASASTPIKRLEVLVTDRCNFRCPYCRGVRPELRGELSLDRFNEYIAASGNIENIRFSGGEPTLNYSLSDMARHSRERGIRRIAVSTNGSAPFELYQQLIEAGVNDFSVSLDACCASGFNEMSGGNGSWPTITRNIRELSSRVYTTVGIVLNEKNEHEAAEIIRFASGLGVSDVRVIPAAQRGRALGAIETPEDGRHPILAYRLNNAKCGIPVRGLKDNDFHRCPLVLDDIAIAGGKHFPCIIYLREGGSPIGEVGGDVRRDREYWFSKTNVQNDHICKQNCLDVCREYNNKWRDYSLSRAGIQKLPTDMFTWSRWRNGSENIKSLVGPWRFENLTSPFSALKLLGVAEGWTFGRELSCRPKDEEIALMFRVGDDYGWLHLRSNELWEIARTEAAHV